MGRETCCVTRNTHHASPSVENEHSVIRHPITRLQVAVRVVEGFDLYDVRFADFVDEVGGDFVEMILADLHTIEVPDAFDAKLDALVGGGVERLERFGNERLGHFVALRHDEMLLT